jgi:predicted  nucleic acid-binding Zn-ribbon protein
MAENPQKPVSLQAEVTRLKAALAEAEDKIKDLERKNNFLNNELQKRLATMRADAAAEAAEAAERARTIAEHTLKPDETLSHLALKYYGNASEKYWRLIYEANKETIGENPNRVRQGMVIKVPVLPEDMK